MWLDANGMFASADGAAAASSAAGSAATEALRPHGLPDARHSPAATHELLRLCRSGSSSPPSGIASPAFEHDNVVSTPCALVRADVAQRVWPHLLPR